MGSDLKYVPRYLFLTLSTLVIFVCFAVTEHRINQFLGGSLAAIRLGCFMDGVHSSIEPLLVETETDLWKKQLFGRLDKIRRMCGNLCNAVTNRSTFESWSIRDLESPFGTRFEFPDVDCRALITAHEIDEGDQSVPQSPPDELMPHYTLDGMIKYSFIGHFKNVYVGGEARTSVWTKDMIEEGFEELENGTLRGTYGEDITQQVRDQLAGLHLIDKSVLVIGSEKPWLEIACLWYGAANVTSLEYGTRKSEHPKIHVLTPSEFRNLYTEDRLERFDVIVSYSSIEHSGLGRYGDQLNPWGDILAIARAWCVTKPGGQMFLGLPVGPDSVEWNAHRVYGHVRWPLVTANWKSTESGRENELEKEVWVCPGFFFTKIEHTQRV